MSALTAAFLGSGRWSLIPDHFGSTWPWDHRIPVQLCRCCGPSLDASKISTGHAMAPERATLVPAIRVASVGREPLLRIRSVCSLW